MKQHLNMILLDGFKDKSTNESVPTDEQMKTILKEVQGFIVPVTNQQDLIKWQALSLRFQKPILGWRLTFKADKEPRSQVDAQMSMLKQKSYLKKHQYVYIDARKSFKDTCDLNNRYVAEIYDEIQLHLKGGDKIGILARQKTWQEAQCNMNFSHVKLYYASYNKKPTFGDYEIFGNWFQPQMKLYDQKQEGDVIYNLVFKKDEPQQEL